MVVHDDEFIIIDIDKVSIGGSNGGGARYAPSHLAVQFFSISCSFREKVIPKCQNNTPLGTPGSATEYSSFK